MIARCLPPCDRPMFTTLVQPRGCGYTPPGRNDWRRNIMERIRMTHLRDLIYRLRAGDSERRIARDMGISRPTVHKYHRLAEQLGYLDTATPLPDATLLAAALGPAPQPPRTPSTAEPYHDTIQHLLDDGIEMAALFARLREDHTYTGSYSAIRRYVHRLCPQQPQAIVRIHTAPGEEAQVDFGPVGQLYDPASGRLRTAYVFVATLSFSRHQYAEFVFDQKTPTWIALHRRAFESWGGVPKRIVPDNLKAAVVHALIDDPVLGDAYRRLAQHYGCLISPTRPATPQHKGKVENGIHYIQRNFMAGQQFASIDVANQRLWVWVREVAGARRHGTTHQAPWRLFHEQEQAFLVPLPPDPFTLCDIKPVKVHPDCHVTIAGSFYSVPYTYIGQTLHAYIEERVVQIFRDQTLVATHPRSQQPGVWSTRVDHYPAEKAAYLERTPDRCRHLAARIGPATEQVVQRLLAERPLDRLRSVQAVLRLAESVGATRLEAACARAVYYGDVHYRRIKEILNAALDREPLPDAAVAVPLPNFVFARPAAEF
ncbi:MAG: IS21 family transposase, partial [Chloroflexi bacterium]|nr:IS21 family transposase [Chloroflexota bacterium]